MRLNTNINKDYNKILRLIKITPDFIKMLYTKMIAYIMIIFFICTGDAFPFHEPILCENSFSLPKILPISPRGTASLYFWLLLNLGRKHSQNISMRGQFSSIHVKGIITS